MLDVGDSVLGPMHARFTSQFPPYGSGQKIGLDTNHSRRMTCRPRTGWISVESEALFELPSIANDLLHMSLSRKVPHANSQNRAGRGMSGRPHHTRRLRQPLAGCPA